MSRVSRFNIQRRERLLALLERGITVTQACKDVEIAKSTLNKWVKDGEALTDNSDKAEFARRYRAILDAAKPVALTTADLVAMLEVQARKGSLKAVELLLKRPWEQEQPQKEPEPQPVSLEDELARRRMSKSHAQ